MEMRIRPEEVFDTGSRRPQESRRFSHPMALLEACEVHARFAHSEPARLRLLSMKSMQIRIKHLLRYGCFPVLCA